MKKKNPSENYEIAFRACPRQIESDMGRITSAPAR